MSNFLYYYLVDIFKKKLGKNHNFLFFSIYLIDAKLINSIFFYKNKTKKPGLNLKIKK